MATRRPSWVVLVEPSTARTGLSHEDIGMLMLTAVPQSGKLSLTVLPRLALILEPDGRD